ncbi:MAG: peptidoglycan-associated lipoprotein Pal [Desulfobacteraceae bacterium]|nr:peptidoglycan-associated lipoprotein Pal [Desulfobacteraceae bacterium]
MAQQRREDELRRKEMEFSSEDVYFEFDSSTLQSSAQRILTDKADYMIAKPEIGVTIEGHCDERGTEAYNMALGERRADSAKSFIVNMGVDDSRVNIISYGEEKPMDTGGDEEAWAKNRRAHFEVE